jgi:hypothetical protein
LTKHFLSKERTCAKKECNSFGKAFLSKKRFVLKEKQISPSISTLIKWGSLGSHSNEEINYVRPSKNMGAYHQTEDDI